MSPKRRTSPRHKPLRNHKNLFFPNVFNLDNTKQAHAPSLRQTENIRPMCTCGDHDDIWPFRRKCARTREEFRVYRIWLAVNTT